jgi:hypothetical protein
MALHTAMKWKVLRPRLRFGFVCLFQNSRAADGQIDRLRNLFLQFGQPARQEPPFRLLSS